MKNGTKVEKLKKLGLYVFNRSNNLTNDKVILVSRFWMGHFKIGINYIIISI
jgi:hypothetical protein